MSNRSSNKETFNEERLHTAIHCGMLCNFILFEGDSFPPCSGLAEEGHREQVVEGGLAATRLETLAWKIKAMTLGAEQEKSSDFVKQFLDRYKRSKRISNPLFHASF